MFREGGGEGSKAGSDDAAGAREGASCSVSAELREVIEGRKLRFDVEVREGQRTIGLGTHERRVIDVERHAASADME